MEKDSVVRGLNHSLRSLSSGSVSGREFAVRAVDGGFIRELRMKLGLTQQSFATKYGFSLRTLQNWEIGNREPEGPAKAYLLVIAEMPKAVSDALEKASIRRVREVFKE